MTRAFIWACYEQQATNLKIDLPVSFKWVAVLGLKVKTGSNCKIDIKFDILSLWNHINDIIVWQFWPNHWKMMANTGHFGFLPVTAYAQTFERDTLQFHYLTFK